MPSSQVEDKQGQPIREGDAVWTKIRGGRREGEVDRVVESADEAEKAGVKNPPKVSTYLPPSLLYKVRMG